MKQIYWALSFQRSVSVSALFSLLFRLTPTGWVSNNIYDHKLKSASTILLPVNCFACSSSPHLHPGHLVLSWQPMKTNGVESETDRWGSSSSRDLQKSWELHVCPQNSRTLLTKWKKVEMFRASVRTSTNTGDNVAFYSLMYACLACFPGLAGSMTLSTVPKWLNVSLTVSLDSFDLLLSCNHVTFKSAAGSPSAVLTAVTPGHFASNVCPLNFVEIFKYSAKLGFNWTA